MQLPILSTARRILPSFRRQQSATSAGKYRVLYTSGDELLTPAAYRSTFEQMLERSFQGRVSVNDSALAKAIAVSATAYAAVEYTANVTAGIPLSVQSPDGDELTMTPLDYFAKQGSSTVHDIVFSLLVWGRCYLLKQYNRAGFPTGLKWLNPQDVRERTDNATGQVLYYEVFNGFKRENVEPGKIVYISMFDVRGDGNGLSKLEVAWRAVGIEQGLSTYAAAFFVNSARPDGMLTFDNPLTDTQFEEAKRQWQQFKGSGNAHKTAVMPGGARWTPIQSAPADLSMSELRQEERKDIAAVFGVDLTLIGLEGVADPLSANSTYSSKEINHLRNTVLPRLRMTILPALNEQWAHADFYPRDHYTFVVEDNDIPALADANLARSETVISLTDSGVVDFAEGRDVLGYAPRKNYMLRKPDDALALFSTGGITLNELRMFTGVKGDDAQYNDPNGEVVLINGQLYPVSRLLEIATKNADMIGTPPPSAFGGFGAPTPPSLPSDPQPPTPALPAPLSPQDAPESQPATDGGAIPTQRAAAPMELAVSLSGHQFVTYARRVLSEHLTEQGVTNVSWVSPDEWRLTLARVDGQAPAAAARLLRAADYDDGRKVDVSAQGYAYVDGAIYLRVEENDALTALRKSAAMDMQPFGNVASDVNGVLLCRVAEPVDVDSVPAERYPLVLAGVSVVYGGDVRHTWALRGADTAQLRELKNWRMVAQRTPKRALTFVVDTLRDHPAIVFTRDALEAGVDVDEVFDTAEAILRGDIVWRSYATTSANFVEAMRELFTQAYDETISRRAFAAQLRARLRRFGLQAFIDGLSDGRERPESLSPDELTIFRVWERETSDYITNVGESLYKGSGTDMMAVDTRAEMWARKSLNDVYYAGLRFAQPAKMATWKYTPEKDHCDDCAGRNNQTRTIDEWGKVGYPTDRRLSCGGWQCGCFLVDEQGERIGVK